MSVINECVCLVTIEGGETCGHSQNETEDWAPKHRVE